MGTLKHIFIILLIAAFASACSSGEGTTTPPTPPVQPVNPGDLPLNISVYLDLSDRLKHGTDGMEQSDKDVEIVDYLVDIFYSSVAKKKEIKAVDAIKVFFYPTPTIPEVNSLAKDLVVDLKATNNKLEALKSMKGKFKSNLEKIYESATQSRNFPGSDIWGFFNEQVDVQCIKKDYRNILVILTDGYIYHENNIVNGNGECSYISRNTLKNNIPLIICRKDLEDLEVLVLEANPNPNVDFPKLQKTLEDWFKGMGIEHVRVVKTDTPVNVTPFIDDFIAK